MNLYFEAAHQMRQDNCQIVFSCRSQESEATGKSFFRRRVRPVVQDTLSSHWPTDSRLYLVFSPILKRQNHGPTDQSELRPSRRR